MEEQKNDLQEELKENTAPVNEAGSTLSASFYEKHKTWIWIVGILIGICIIYSLFSGLGTKRYVGSNTTCEVVVELKSDDTFTLEVTFFKTGEIYELAGAYKLLGTNEDVLQLNFDDGEVWTCDINVNIHGTPYIFFANNSSVLPACYLQ